MGEADKDINTYSVKEILTDFVMPALTDLRDAAATKSREDNARFEALESSKNRMVGALILISSLLVPLSIPIIGAALR